MNYLPAHIGVAEARLPATYESAKQALANCVSIDECQDWANKAEALASYAKQADDDSLRKMADRIQARAVRRCGELLKQFDGRPQNAAKQIDGVGTLISRREAAESAGMSERQQVTAVRVSNVPAGTFDLAVESEDPPTVTQLAEMGTQKRLPSQQVAPERPAGFKEATQLLGTVERFADFCSKHDPALVAGGVMPSEASEARRQVGVIDSWLDRFVTSLKG